MLTSFSGLKVTVSVNATTTRENWPVKKRSARLHKKLTKRLGPQFTAEPAMFKTPFGLVVHPDIYAQLRAQSAQIGRQI